MVNIFITNLAYFITHFQLPETAIKINKNFCKAPNG